MTTAASNFVTLNPLNSSQETTAASLWPEFGALQFIEVIYLTIITVLGTIGNLIVICSITLERRVHAHGNIFIINLAVADLIVSAFIVPTVIANVVEGGNALETIFCSVIGYLVTTTCTCSLCNLMFIAINRYWAVVKSGTYQKVFSRKHVYYMVVFTWIWSIILVCPTVLGWGGLRYDAKMMICSWDDVKDASYTYFIAAVAIFCPLVLIAFCYFKLFATVRGSGRWVRSLSVGSGISHNSEQHRRSMRKERSLLRTLLTTVLLFCVCWVPFGACVLINPSGTPKHAKKVFGWLALTNSCVNFIIYGAMNPVFRRGYHNLFLYIFRCKRVQQLSSAMLHGSFSDSYRGKRGTKSNIPNGKNLSRSDTNRENSRIDTITGVPINSQQTTHTTFTVNTPNMTRVRAAINEPSPLAVQRKAPAPELPPPSPKKGIVETIRRASLMRKPRPRANTHESATTEEERQRRQKRNSAMLLQIQMGEDELNSDDEFALNQRERSSRRAMSDLPPKTNTQADDSSAHYVNENTNHNCNGITDIAKIAGRKWIPKANVQYVSNNSIRILGKGSPKKNATKVFTTTRELEHYSRNEQNDADADSKTNVKAIASKETPADSILTSNSTRNQENRVDRSAVKMESKHSN